MPFAYIDTLAGQPLTLNMLVEMPLVIRERFLQLMADQFICEKVLRYAGTAPGGAVTFRVSSGLFADQPSSIVNQRAEIPLATVTKGDINTASTRKHGLAVSFPYELRDMDVSGEVQRQLTVVQNTMLRDIDGAFLVTLTVALTSTRVATAPWASSLATIRKDIIAARGLVNRAIAPGTVGTGSSASYLQYQADTMIINPLSEDDLLGSAEFLAMMYGQVNPNGIGQLPPELLTLTIFKSFSQPVGTAKIVEAGTIGGYADRIPLNMTPLYDWAPSQLFRADATRDTTAFVDQPLAGSTITGI